MIIIMLSLAIVQNTLLPAFGEPPLFQISVSTPQNEVAIGDWIQIDFVVSNLTQSEMKVIKPILDIDSVSFAISCPSKSFVYPIITPSVYEHKRDKLETILLSPYDTLTSAFKATFNLPAVALGLWQITAYYQGGRYPVSAEPITVNVIPPKTEPDRPKARAN
jgi:hypothetical protein